MSYGLVLGDFNTKLVSVNSSIHRSKHFIHKLNGNKCELYFEHRSFDMTNALFFKLLYTADEKLVTTIYVTKNL
jgi:hypothetical protein